MEDLVTWLRAQLDEDERVAREAADGASGRWFFGDKWNVYRAEDIGGDEGEINELVVYGNVKPQSEHIARHDPARVLREVEAKRKIIDKYAEAAAMYPADGRAYDWDSEHGRTRTAVLAECVCALALPYADRPGYQESWRP